MQVTFSAAVTFEIDNEPKGPHGKAFIERGLIDLASGHVVDPAKPIILESDLGKHSATIVEIFIHDPRGPKINHRYEETTSPLTEQDRAYRNRSVNKPGF